MTDEGPLTLTSRSPDQTRDLGAATARSLPDGALVALFGDLGAGKTAFVQGMARAAGVPPEIPVVSPTYTLIHEYPGRRLLIHVDLYRLAGGADLEDIGLYELMDGEALVAVEWADRLDPAERESHLSVRLSILDERVRRIEFAAVGAAAGEWIRRIDTAVKELAWL